MMKRLSLVVALGLICANANAQSLIYNGEKSPNQLSVSDKGADLKHWSESLQPDNTRLSGFANQQWFITDTMSDKPFSQGKIYQVSQHDSQIKATRDTLASTRQQHVAVCQAFEKQDLSSYQIKMNKGTVAIYDSQSSQQLASLPLTVEEIHHTMCGNVDASMTPSLLLLVKQEGRLKLHVIPQNSWQNDESWHIVDLGIADKSTYALVPDAQHHSLQQLQVWQDNSKDKAVNQWEKTTVLSINELVKPFEYQASDFSTVWMQSTSLSRAGAKLMWNFGARSLDHFDKYVRSVGLVNWSDPTQMSNAILESTFNMDPNQNSKAVAEVTEHYVKWKSATLDNI